MLPPPTLSFTIPSIYDGSILECRIYHPICLTPTSTAQVLPWSKKAAIVAHPYAPLGGSYDDAVVDLVGSTVLKEGFIVGTFNFRGAGSSKGHTSWSSVPEQNDYMSFLGFMVTYLHYLAVPNPSKLPPLTLSEPQLQIAPVPSRRLLESANDNPSAGPTFSSPEPGSSDLRPLLLLAGYSYGSLVTINLEPSILSILAPFQNPVSGCPYADIRSRARFLATQQNEAMETTFSIFRAGSHRRGRSLQLGEQIVYHRTRQSGSGVRMGGDEDIRRTSHDIHGSGVKRSFSIDSPRKSLDKIKSVVQPGSPRRQSFNPTTNRGQDSGPNMKNAEMLSQKSHDKIVDLLGDNFKTAYLLVSPLPPDGLINSLASIGSLRPTFLFGKQGHKAENDIKFTVDPTLIIYGTGDLFVNIRTFERWTEKLSNICKGRDPAYRSTFRYEVIEGGEHFWKDRDAAMQLRAVIRRFLVEIPKQVRDLV